MRTDQREALDRILAAAHIDDESRLPGAARLALHRLVRDDRVITGLVELVDAARRVGELEGLADRDNGCAP